MKGIPNNVSVLTEMFPFDYLMLACDGMIIKWYRGRIDLMEDHVDGPFSNEKEYLFP